MWYVRLCYMKHNGEQEQSLTTTAMQVTLYTLLLLKLLDYNYIYLVYCIFNCNKMKYTFLCVIILQW